MPGTTITSTEQTVQACLMRAGLIDATCGLIRLRGGRTNLVWRIRGGQTPLICKLSLPGRGTPMFPNLPGAESTALQTLGDTGIAPQLEAVIDTVLGSCLIYRACPGSTWATEPTQVGVLLARLHGISPPRKLRQVQTGPKAVLADGDRILRQLAMPGDLAACRPDALDQPEGPQRFLHGDPVPGNIIVAGKRAMLIDWQCPALGDPVHDLALFLSPAMQTLGRGAPLSRAERRALLEGYGDRQAEQRFILAEPALTWRMAVYCAWRIERGHADYVPALRAELDRLQQLREEIAQNHGAGTQRDQAHSF